MHSHSNNRNISLPLHLLLTRVTIQIYYVQSSPRWWVTTDKSWQRSWYHIFLQNQRKQLRKESINASWYTFSISFDWLLRIYVLGFGFFFQKWENHAACSTHTALGQNSSSVKGLGFSSSRGSSASSHGFASFGLSNFAALETHSKAGGLGVVALGGVLTGVTTGVSTQLVVAGISTPAWVKSNFRSERNEGTKSQAES